MVMSPAGLGCETGCVDKGQQQLHVTDPTSRKTGRPILKTKVRKDNFQSQERKIGRGSQMVA
jgi:hypothetical protein